MGTVSPQGSPSPSFPKAEAAKESSEEEEKKVLERLGSERKRATGANQDAFIGWQAGTACTRGLQGSCFTGETDPEQRYNQELVVMSVRLML